MRILIAEDEVGVALCLQFVLKIAGHYTTVAANGIQALRALDMATQPFDLLVTDNVMPQMGGMELVRTLASSVRKCPIIFMSGVLTPDERLALHEAGVSGFVEKPFERALLLEAVDACKTSVPV
jgi:CheY-like chemotaxis protein